MRARTVAATAFALLAAAPASSSEAAAPACRPLGGARTDDIAVARTGTRSELTEYAGNGGYRVSYCSASGALMRSQEVAPVAVPGGKAALLPVSAFDTQGAVDAKSGGAGVVTSITYAEPTDPVFEEQWARAAGGSLSAVMPPTLAMSPRGTPTGVTAAVAAAARRGMKRTRSLFADDGCSNRQYSFTGLQLWTGRYDYYANLGNMPHGDNDRQEITKGHHTWNNTWTRCGFPDVTNVIGSYAGATSATPHSYTDGINVVDFGSIGSLAGGCGGQVSGVLACTFTQTAEGVYFSNIDQRYSTEFSWSTSGAAGAYDVWSVATHESGHGVGLGHANSSRYLTMYYQIARGETYKRTLALGDAIGLRCRYGVTAGGC